MTKDEILEKIQTDDGFEELIAQLTEEDIKKYLIYINAESRGIPIEEGGLFQPEGKYLDDGTYTELYMRVNGLKAPKKEIQDKYFEKILEVLKKVEGRKNKATVIFYLINYLHLFRDGNGRTSRMIYDLIANGKIEENDKSMYTHSENEIMGKRLFFLNQRNISDPGLVENCASFFLMRYLINAGLINSNNEDILKHASIQTRTLDSNVYINEQSKKALSKKSVFQIGRALNDNNETISSSALAMLIILSQKKELRELKDYYFGNEWKITGSEDLLRNAICIGSSTDEDSRINGILPIDISKKIFDNWTPEDYLRAIKLVDKLKECILDLIIDFAERPKSFAYGGDRNMLDVMTNEEKLGRNIPEIINLASTAITYDKDSRVAARIQEVRNILEETIELPPVASTESLGTQTKKIDPNSKNEAAKKLKESERKVEFI